MVIWLYHVIVLIIISNNILLNLLIELATFLCTNLFFKDDNSTLYYY